jgi:hypothetical protein
LLVASNLRLQSTATDLANGAKRDRKSQIVGSMLLLVAVPVWWVLTVLVGLLWLF